MKNKKLFLFLFLAIAILALNAQNGTIQGIVRSEKEGSPMPGTHVLLNGSKVSITNNKGQFIFKGLEAGEYEISASYVGFTAFKQAVSLREGEQQNLDIRLVETTYMADEAVISATGVKIARKDVSPSISIVPRQTIEESRESALLNVLSEEVPGLFVTSRGITGFGVAEGSAGQISIRGVGGSPNTGILVLIDGSPQYMGLFGHPLPDAYVSSDAERVEVIRGPASVMYGSNAMAGAINIITREQKNEGFGGQARMSYGSFNTRKLMGNAGYRKQGFEVFASINHDHTDGHRENADFDIVNGYLKVSSETGKHFRISVDGNIASFRTSDPGPATNPDSSYLLQDHWVDINRYMLSMSLENTFAKAEGALKVFYNAGEHKIYSGFHSRDHNYGFSLYESFGLFRGNSLSIGIDMKNTGGIAENPDAMMGAGIVFADTSILETGGYVQVQQKIRESWILTGGLRLQHHDISGYEWVPQAGVNYLINANNIAKLSLSKGFRNPTIRELFMWESANPDLKPESMWCYEGSYLLGIPSQDMQFEGTVYYQYGQNLIKTMGVYPDIRYMNTGEFSHYGLELIAKWKISRHFSAESNYSWLNMDEPVIAAATHQWYTALRYTGGKLEIKLSGMYINGLYTSTEPVTTQSYYMLNSRVSYQLFPFMNIWISGDNLLDQEYEINYDYPMPGISVMGGIDLKFEAGKK